MVARRAFLASIGAVAHAACASRPAPPSAPSTTTPKPSTAPIVKPVPPVDRTIEVLDWTFPTELGGEKRAVILVPRPVPAGVRLPVLVALHGLGETVSSKAGAYGWPESYALTQTYERMLHPPLDPEAFQGLVTSERLTEINESLEAQPLRGVIVACPYLPRDIGGSVPIDLYAKWLGERLLPRVREELPAATDAKATGIDGVSLGGWAGIRIAMARPDLFGAVGALQPAILDWPQVESAAALIAQKLDGRPLRIVTSTEDLYRPTLVALDEKLTAKGVPHEFAITQGPHDYPWNKGPGGVEMLLWHDRILRR